MMVVCPNVIIIIECYSAHDCGGAVVGGTEPSGSGMCTCTTESTGDLAGRWHFISGLHLMDWAG